ncbi:MAG: hypothetical protein QXZ10_00825 [Sulfolobales archaeon]
MVLYVGMESEVSENERIWGFVGWLASIVGAVLVLILKPEYRYAKYWAYLSISFFVITIVSGVVVAILSLIPLIGWFIGLVIQLVLLITWVLGIIKSLSRVFWRPPLIYDLAKIFGIERI